MRWIIALMSLAVCLMPWRVLAQEALPQALLDALVARTPGATLSRMRDRPKAFVQEAVGLILGYGGPEGLSAQDVETAIAAELARIRARELRRLLDADLNGDLSVSGDELAVLIHAASATMRGRLMVWHRASDLKPGRHGQLGRNPVPCPRGIAVPACADLAQNCALGGRNGWSGAL